MFANLKTWHYPKTINEAIALLKKGEVLPHAGGTGLIRVGSNRVCGLVDLRRLPLTKMVEENHYFSIGAGVTFAQIASWQQLTGAASILRQAAGMAASTPLRNRITIGGSIASPPLWSDIPPVLIALDAKIEIKGESQGIFPANEYFQNIPHDGRSLITEIVIPKLPGKAIFERVTQTRFDYSMLDLAIYLSIEHEKIKTIRIVIGCSVPRAVRLTKVEDFLTGQQPVDELFSKAAELADFNPVEDKRASKEYRQQLLKILLQRNLLKLITATNLSE